MASDTNQTARRERLAALKQKLRARDGDKAYRENIPALKAEIARLENTIATVEAHSDPVEGE